MSKKDTVAADAAAPTYSARILELVRQAIQARDNDARTDEEKIADAVDFICDTRLDLPTSAVQPDERAAVSRDTIREVFMAHGFTVKEGQADLKQYVYDAAYALLARATAPQATPHPEYTRGWQDCLSMHIAPQATVKGDEPIAQYGGLPTWFDNFLRNVAELPNRNSPDDEPEAMIATSNELRNCAVNAIDQYAEDRSDGLSGPLHGWGVYVERNGYHFLTISDKHVAGEEITDDLATLIRTAAKHLASFAGDEPDARAAVPQAGAKGDESTGALFDPVLGGVANSADAARAVAPQATITKLAESNAELRAQIERYQAICASAYQLAGAVDAPLRFLDALASAANGDPVSEEAALDLLPVTVEECAGVQQAGATLTDEQIISQFYIHTVMDDEPLFTFDRKSALELARALLSANREWP